MARRQRIHIEGAFYHVMLRGNGGQAIFADDADRRVLERLLADGVERFGHRVHAFCWMTNHLHLCVQVASVPLSRIVQNVAFRYTRAWNRRYRRVGHLFQGRFRALMVGDESYLLALVRYIHRNPVEAGLVGDATDWVWSSHAAYVGRRRAPDWLTTDTILDRLAPDPSVAARRMAAWIADRPVDPAAEAAIDRYADAFDGRQIALGDVCGARTAAEVPPWAWGAPQVVPFRPMAGGMRRHRLGLAPPPPAPAVLVEVASRAACVERTAVETGSNAPGAVLARGLAASLAADLRAATLADMARHLGRDPTALGRAAAKARAALDADATLAARYAAERDALIWGQACKPAPQATSAGGAVGDAEIGAGPDAVLQA